MDKIHVFKLVTNEWVVGEVEVAGGDGLFSVPKGDVVLISPMLIHVVPQGEQSYGLALMPYNPTNPDAKLEVFAHAIVATSEPTKQLADAYMRQRSGIEIVSGFPGM